MQEIDDIPLNIDDIDNLALLINTPAQTKSPLHCLKQVYGAFLFVKLF